jgi:FkbM family methyltransferase
MLNPELGSTTEVNGEIYIQTEPGKVGHVVYGPYIHLAPGRYVVGFELSAAELPPQLPSTCAIIDVVTDVGHTSIVSNVIKPADLASGKHHYHLEFTLAKTSEVEFRVHVDGQVPLRIAERRPLKKLESGENAADVIAKARYPAIPASLSAVEGSLRGMYLQGADIAVENGEAIVDVSGLKFYANTVDDVSLTHEVLFDQVYRIDIARPALTIDIGMNLGLSCLTFARHPNIRMVHGYEPFHSTFDRAIRNLKLNPRLSDKIVPHCIGLSNYSDDADINTFDVEWSGSMSIFPNRSGEGPSHHVAIRDAALELGPIIKQARQDKLDVILKVDCEGSEFAIFESLHKADLFRHISAVMTEWHAFVEGKDLADLLDPLKQAGFIVFDRSPPKGNGFFYAARLAAE